MGFSRGFFMVIENRLRTDEVQSASPLASDAYEVYWRSTDEDGQARSNNRSYLSSDPGRYGETGDAYSELWQLWDAA
jgi:hypothetical protein